MSIRLIENLLKEGNEINLPNSSGTIGVRQKIKEFLKGKPENTFYLLSYYDGASYKKEFVAKLKVIEYSYDEDDFTIGFIEKGSRHLKSRQLDYYKLKSIKIV